MYVIFYFSQLLFRFFLLCLCLFCIYVYVVCKYIIHRLISARHHISTAQPHIHACFSNRFSIIIIILLLSAPHYTSVLLHAGWLVWFERYPMMRWRIQEILESRLMRILCCCCCCLCGKHQCTNASCSWLWHVHKYICVYNFFLKKKSYVFWFKKLFIK